MSWRNRMLRLPLQFFAADGEGAGAGDATGGGVSESGAGAEISNDDIFLAEMEQKYGITDGVASAQARQKVNTDNGQSLESKEADGSPEHKTDENDAEANMGNEKNPDDEFSELIKGKFKAQYGKRVQEAISERFKSQKNAQAETDKLKSVAALMAQKYGLSDSDYDGIIAAMEADDELYEAQAMRENLTAKEVRERTKDLRDKKASEDEITRLRSQLEAKERNEQARADVMRWQTEAEETVKKYANFDLRTELKNPKFLKYLKSDEGMTVTEAYEHAHMQEILDNSVKAAEKRAREDSARAVRQNRSRMTEGARTPHAQSPQRVDLKNMSDEEFNRIEALLDRGVRVDSSYFK